MDSTNPPTVLEVLRNRLDGAEAMLVRSTEKIERLHQEIAASEETQREIKTHIEDLKRSIALLEQAEG